MKKILTYITILFLILSIGIFFYPKVTHEDVLNSISQSSEEYNKVSKEYDNYQNNIEPTISTLKAIFICCFFLSLSIKLFHNKNIKNAEENERKRNRFKEIGIEKVIYAGKYLTGHSKIKESINVSIYFKDDNIHIVKNDSTIQELGIIPLTEISDIKVEDASTVESRVTATRLLALGIFAFAAKKKEKTELYYLTITWKDGKFSLDTIFEFTGPKSMGTANELKSIIVEKANQNS